MADSDTTNFVDRIVNFFVVNEGKKNISEQERNTQIGEGQCRKLVKAGDKIFAYSAPMTKQFSPFMMGSRLKKSLKNKLNFQISEPNLGSFRTASVRC